MNRPRIVFDTNLVVSAALSTCSPSRQAFDLGIDQGALLVSLATVEELEDVLRPPKFDRYSKEEVRVEFMDAMLSRAMFVEITERIVEARDPKDDKFLELAVSGFAQVIVSGDDDLRTLNHFRGIPIESPAQFLSLGIERFE